jgi:hypothetical protein
MSDQFGPDQYSDLTTQGWGQRILGGFVAMLFGVARLPIGLACCIGTRSARGGRARRSAKRQPALPRPQRKPVNPALDGRLVHVRGTLVAATPARDPVFGVSQGRLLPLSPAVETCQWRQDVSSHGEPSLGGTKTKVKRYSYHPVWSAVAINSGRGYVGAAAPLPAAGPAKTVHRSSAAGRINVAADSIAWCAKSVASDFARHGHAGRRQPGPA